MKRIFFGIGLLGMALIPQARAEYTLFCGEGRESGAEKAEFAYVLDSNGFDEKVYMNGKALPEGKFAVKGGEHRMYFTIFDQKGGKNYHRLEFREKEAELLEFIGPEDATDHSKEKQIGPARKCLVHEDPLPEEES